MVSGPLAEVLECPHSRTGLYLSGRQVIPLPESRRDGNGKSLVIKGARQNNLKNVMSRYLWGSWYVSAVFPDPVRVL